MIFIKILIAISVIIALLVIFFAFYLGAPENAIKKRAIAHNALFSGNFSHHSGLSAPAGIACYLYCYKEGISIEVNGSMTQLPYPQIQDMAKLNADALQNYLYNNGGNANGYGAFNPCAEYLVITTSMAAQPFIFETTKFSKADSFVNQFRQQKPAY